MLKSALKKQKLLITMAVVAAIIAAGWFMINQLRYRDFTGTVTQVGLQGAAADGPVYYQVQVSDKKSQDVYLTVSPTPDNPIGTPLPNVKVGDKVKVHANKGANGASLVGAKGTYITPQK